VVNVESALAAAGDSRRHDAKAADSTTSTMAARTL
jgi:hypothetical protein